MAIITLEKAKEILQIPTATTTYDDLITSLIPIVQKAVVRYCRNSFVNANIQYGNSTFAFVNGTPATITDSDEQFVEELFVAGDYKIQGSLLNDKIVEIDTVAVGTLTLDSTETLVAEDEAEFVYLTKVEFPEDIQFHVAMLIKWYMTTQGKQVKSESLPGGYSVTFMSPTEIMQPFNLYRKPYA